MAGEFDFKPGKREQVKLLIGLAGAPGSGKTKSALELATGLAGPRGKIAVIDSEARRCLHYATEYDFSHLDMRAPFRPNRMTQAIKAAENFGADVIIIDSMSHEYDGIGGILDWAADLEASGTKSPGNWKVPKSEHKKMMNEILQSRAHIIFCMRAEEKIKIVDNPNGRGKAVEHAGWMPICEKRFMYEMTISFTLRPDDPGKPQYDLTRKVQEQHKVYFPEGKFITRETGAKLAEWADGGEPSASVPYRDFAMEYMYNAVDAKELGEWWNSDDQKSQRKREGVTGPELTELQSAVRDRIAALKSAAPAADQPGE